MHMPNPQQFALAEDRSRGFTWFKYSFIHSSKQTILEHVLRAMHVLSTVNKTVSKTDKISCAHKAYMGNYNHI